MEGDIAKIKISTLLKCFFAIYLSRAKLLIAFLPEFLPEFLPNPT